MDRSAYVNFGKSCTRLQTEQPLEKKAFNSDVELILRKPDTKENQALFYFISRTLVQFELDGRYDIFDIFSEAYLRGIRKVEAGEVIKNSRAWLRGTSYNIIRELKRKHKSEHTVETSVLELKLEHLDSDADIERDFAIDILSKLLKGVDPFDVYIVCLHIIEGLPWLEVSKRVKEEKNIDISDSALRKRHSRLQKLLYQSARSIMARTDIL